MIIVKDIITTHKDEGITIFITLNDEDGNTVSSPASYTVTLVFSTTEEGDALGGSSFAFNLFDVDIAKFRRVLSASDLSILTEGTTYFYNIWSKFSTDDPVLRVKGRITLDSSISLP